MPQVEIAIGGRSFEVSCQPGEEAFLRTAAELLDAEATALSSQIGRMPEARMLLMAGLMLADKTAGLEDRLRDAEARVEELEDQLSRAVVIEGHERTQVDLGSVVTLKSPGEELRVQLVSPVEAEVVSEPPHISDASPLGQALLGRKVGDTFTLKAGGRSTDYEVTNID